jgi:beta-phosphoglucomutase-like phosphatase (HAD superfamily)
VKAVLDQFGWQGVFDYTISSDDILHSKPAPDAFLKAAELAGEPPARCVVIEDSTNGVKAAKRAGAFCIGYQSDLAPYQDLSEADLIVNKLGDVQVETLEYLLKGQGK